MTRAREYPNHLLLPAAAAYLCHCSSICSESPLNGFGCAQKLVRSSSSLLYFKNQLLARVGGKQHSLLMHCDCCLDCLAVLEAQQSSCLPVSMHGCMMRVTGGYPAHQRLLDSMDKFQQFTSILAFWIADEYNALRLLYSRHNQALAHHRALVWKIFTCPPDLPFSKCPSIAHFIIVLAALP